MRVNGETTFKPPLVLFRHFNAASHVSKALDKREEFQMAEPLNSKVKNRKKQIKLIKN